LRKGCKKKGGPKRLTNGQAWERTPGKNQICVELIRSPLRLRGNSLGGKKVFRSTERVRKTLAHGFLREI